MTLTQASLARALRNPEQPVPAGLVDAMGRQAGRRFATHRNTIAVTLREALAAGFPATARLLGETNFARIAGGYVAQSPPDSPILMHYGAGFPAYLDALLPALPQLAHMDYLPDVARLDLMLRHAAHAEDSRPVEPGQLAALTPETLQRMRLVLAPSLRVLQSRWPVAQLHARALSDDAPAPQPGGEDIVITRPGFDPQIHRLPPGGALLLTRLQDGEPLGEALHGIPEDSVQEVLARLVTQSALTALILPEGG